MSFSVFSSRFYKPDRRTVRGSFLFSFFIDVKNLQKHKKKQKLAKEKKRSECKDGKLDFCE